MQLCGLLNSDGRYGFLKAIDNQNIDFVISLIGVFVIKFSICTKDLELTESARCYLLL